MLTTERMQEIMVAATTGENVQVEGKEERKFFTAFSADLDEAEEKGWVIDIPAEWDIETD